jgi:hypothetical protein
MAVETFEFFENHLLFVFRNTRPTVPDFQAQLAFASTNTQQHRPFGVAEGVGEEVLQNPAQQFDVAVDAQLAAPDAELQFLFSRQRLEFGAEGVEQLIEGERLGIGIDLAVFQAGDVQQVADQVFGRTQRAVQVLTSFCASPDKPSS